MRVKKALEKYLGSIYPAAEVEIFDFCFCCGRANIAVTIAYLAYILSVNSLFPTSTRAHACRCGANCDCVITYLPHGTFHRFSCGATVHRYAPLTNGCVPFYTSALTG